MSEASEEYTVKILFDPVQTNEENLRKQAEGILNQYLSKIKLAVGETTSGNLILSVTGPLKMVDSCNREITNVLIRKLELHHFRLIDEVGDEIRKQAYPILASIEQDLRAFVNQSILEVLGFEWWMSLGESEIPGIKRERLSDKHAEHPLELATFEDLLKIVTAEVVEWDEDKVLTQADMVQLLADSTSFEELKSKLEAKSKRYSFWDNVFAKYFEDEQKWIEYKRELNFIIFIRNKVMHHRPINHGELIKLQVRSAILGSLLSAKSNLSVQERATVQENFKDLRLSYATLVQKTTEANTYSQLFFDFHEATNVNYLVQKLRELDDLRTSEGLSDKEVYDLKVTAFQKLQTITKDEPAQAEPILLDELLPLAITIDQNQAVHLNRLLKCLADWLNQYNEPIRAELIDKILDKLYPHLEGSNPRAACWTVSYIGFRSEKILNALWKLVNNDNNELGDIALATIINLGIPLPKREVIRAELHKRVVARFGRFLVNGLVQFADSTSIKIVVDHWLASGNEELPSIDLALAFVAVRDILDEHSHDSSLQDQTWQNLTSLAQEKTKDFANAVYKKDLVNACNSPFVIASMLERMTKGLEQEENSSGWRYIAALTLENCIRPNQLEGWQEIAKQPLNWDILRQDACQDTGSDIFMTTTDHERKRAAWEILFRAKYLEALNWLEEAVVSETSRFLQQQIIDLFACFKIEPLPGFIKHWITERFDDQLVDGDSRELSRRTAAVRLARSATSQEAFDSLLNFGYTHKGQTLRDSSDALTEVSVFLVNEGNKEIESRLIETITTSEEAQQSVAAAMALGHVVSLDGSSLSNQVERILPLLFDSDRQDFERGALLSALGRLPNWQVPGNVLQKIEEWAVEPNRWLSGSSLEVLAHHRILHERPELLKKSLGLIQINGQWGLAPDTKLTDWAPYFIGLLYKKYPESYLPAIVALLTNSTWFPIGIATWLQDIYSSAQTILPQEISQALVQRIYEKQSSTYSETDIFDLLAEISPEALVTENWKAVWDNWLQSARAGLADALGQLTLSPALQLKAIGHLKLLALDSQYAVRRSAYRGLARQSLITLYTECLSWANPENPVELRKRAAEAFGWLDTVEGPISIDDLGNLRQSLKTDVEKVVRETINRSEKERRQRSWAEQYLSIILGVEGKSNEEIMNVWCYAEALAKVGDDACIEILKKHLQKNLPPNVRYWINRLIKSMKTNWRKVTDKWPDPWFAWDGIIEQGQGKAIVSENEIIDIEYSVWQQRASRPSDTSKWGGAMWPVPYFQADKIKMIELENGSQGEIQSTNISNERIIFSGQGYYPGAE